MSAAEQKLRCHRWYRTRWGLLVICFVGYVLSYFGFRLASEAWAFRDNERGIEFQAFYFVESRGVIQGTADDLPSWAPGFRETESLLVFVYFPLIELEKALTGNLHASRFNALTHHEYGRFTPLF